ncbi:MAG: tRNA (N6-threonylcarbamoyladenosine(37)-N6)-methyltransferase TrmO [Polyangiales bacterium]
MARRGARGDDAPAPLPELLLQPIGVAHTPFRDKRSAPRQPAAASGTAGTIELLPRSDYEHALADLDTFTHIWVIFWFHLNRSFRAKVQPPRSTQKRGLFATRSPYRPNPLGLSVLRLQRIEGHVLHVLDVDMLDGTPVLDIKPYVPYADAIPQAHSGWLQPAALPPEDPGPRYRVRYSPRAREQLAWLAERTDVPFAKLAEHVLELGPTPHPYRRIKRDGDVMRLAVKDFRLRFVVEGDEAVVLELATGYRERVLRDPTSQATERTPLEVHRAFVEHFGGRS